MMKRAKPIFPHWRPATDRLFGTGPESPPAKMKAASRRLHEAIVGLSNGPDDYLMSTAQAVAERVWHREGRPYFKVHGQVADWLKNTSMNFMAENFSVPFNVFSVMLPASFGRVGTFLVYAATERSDADEQIGVYDKHRDDADPAGAKFCSEVADFMRSAKQECAQLEQKYGEGKLQLCFTWEDLDGGFAHAHMLVYESTTLDEALKILDDQVADMSGILDPTLTWERRREMIRVAVGVAMFAVNKHELVAPDVNIEQLQSRFPGGRSQGSAMVAQKAIAREIANCRGWTIGEEISLPRPEYTPHPATGEGHSLGFGHVRSGHMRMQPHGPHNSLRKLIFVAPTVVRKDLPMQPHRGFQIRDGVVPLAATAVAGLDCV